MERERNSSLRLLCAALALLLAVVPAVPGLAQDPGLRFNLDLIGEIEAEPEKAQITATLTPSDAQPGDEVTLAITAQLPPGHYTYSTNRELNQTAATLFQLEETVGLEPVGKADFQPDHPPKQVFDEVLERDIEKFTSDVTWTKTFRIKADAKPEDVRIGGQVRWQVCNDRTCRPDSVPIAVTLVEPSAAAADDIPAAAPAPEEEPAAVEPAASDETSSEPEAVLEAKPTAGTAAVVGPELSQGLLAFLITAALAGFASLLTPCVFPMVPITVSVFLKQAEREHHRPVFMASVYAGGIVLAFTTLGMVVSALFSATALNEMANYVSFNLLMAALLVFFGLNLLGMFELRVPGWLLTWSAAHESQGGVVGVLFMALTFTLVSFTCTFAFLGMLLALAAKGHVLWPMLGMLVFSSAFALPFFFLALFPSFLHKLPKSGGWMNTVKVTMGLIELAFALKFLSVADAAFNPLPVLFDYTFVITGWMMIAGCTGLYLLGLFRLPHDTPTQNISAVRFLFAMGFLGLASYMAVGLFAAAPPTGALWDQIHALAPPKIDLVMVEAPRGPADAEQAALGPAVSDHGLAYALDYEQALAFARQSNRPVFIDFTGVNCPNCRLMEKRMAQPELHNRLAQFVRIKVYTDSVPGFSGEKEDALLAKNRQFQQEWYNDTSLPAYAVLTAGREMLARTTGLQPAGEFAEFLDTGLERWQQQAGRLGRESAVVAAQRVQ